MNRTRIPRRRKARSSAPTSKPRAAVTRVCLLALPAIVCGRSFLTGNHARR